ncbi:hypothetical protein NDU88_004270 [Pleurodeles waltl]|uniref:Uncharacterized protein n=1 Tax=Pleurodeles waltl TaxID=8319 RepID=A0AAV7TS02_PLEWA|nr:hypothetical protein NDU88_004270 [Pleurodeles waltl]
METIRLLGSCEFKGSVFTAMYRRDAGRANRKTEAQLGLTIINLQQLNTRVKEVEQWVSNLEDGGLHMESSIRKYQAELANLQIWVDDAENRSRPSNLRFTRIPEGRENGHTVIKLFSDLIIQYVLTEAADSKTDLTITRAHRVPTVQPPSAKYLQTIVVNFGDYCIKERILSLAIKSRAYSTPGDYSFKIFSDMSALAARRHREFKELIPDFQIVGEPAHLVQQSKLKVPFKVQANIFHTVEAAKGLLNSIRIADGREL